MGRARIACRGTVNAPNWARIPLRIFGNVRHSDVAMKLQTTSTVFPWIPDCQYTIETSPPPPPLLPTRTGHRRRRRTDDSSPVFSRTTNEPTTTTDLPPTTTTTAGGRQKKQRGNAGRGQAARASDRYHDDKGPDDERQTTTTDRRDVVDHVTCYGRMENGLPPSRNRSGHERTETNEKQPGTAKSYD